MQNNSQSKQQDPLTRERVLLAAILGIFLGSLGIQSFMTRKYAIGLIHLALVFSGVGLGIVVFAIMFFDAFKCGTGSMCPSLNIQDWMLAAAFNIPMTISSIIAVVEVIILFVSLPKYPSEKQIKK